MARRGKDLFQLLQVREKRGSRASTTAEGVRGRVRKLLGGEAPGQAPGRPAPRRGFAVGGYGLAAVVFASTALGFLLGNGFSREGGTDLNAPRHAGAGTERPGQRGVIEGPEREEARLADGCYLLAQYPAHQRTQAADLAATLRAENFPNARICRFSRREGDIWITVVYSDSEDPGLVQRLRAVDDARLASIRDNPDWPPYGKL